MSLENHWLPSKKMQIRHDGMRSSSSAPNGTKAADTAHVVFSEALSIAAFSLLAYLAVGAFTVGYQFQFGFTYISLGIETLVDAGRQFIIPCSESFLFALFLTFALRRWFTQRVATHAAVVIWPLILIGVIFANFMSLSDLAVIDRTTYYGAVIYTIFAALSLKLDPATFLSRRASNAILSAGATVLIFLLAFDVGASEALHQRQFLRCPDFDRRQWLVVQYTDTVFVCAEADLTSRKVFANFRFIDLDDHGLNVETIDFAPLEIGVVRPQR